MAITSLVRILASIGMIIFAGAVAAGATGAFFSDTETSTGNTLAAGAIDLQIDNESYVTNSSGDLVASPGNTWSLTNLTNELFFSFTDLKPGDIGEDTISLHAGNNDAWACMAVDITATPENSLEEAEIDANDPGTAGGDDGELQDHLNVAFWRDDGDNVFEVGEPVLLNLTGTVGSVFNGAWNAIADSANLTAIAANATAHVGKAWCFGALTQAPASQDNLGGGNNNGPLVRGTGFSCSGTGDQNAAQSDGIVADVSFYAEQTRNNGSFLCANLPPIQTFDVTVTADDEETIGDTTFAPNMDDNQLVISTKEHYGVHIVHSGAGMSNVNWRITISGPAGFDPTTEVDLQEEGFEDVANGPTVAIEQYVFNGAGVAEGSVFDLDANDVFENVDSLHFLTGAPSGQYTITRTLVDAADNSVSNSLVKVVTLVP